MLKEQDYGKIDWVKSEAIWNDMEAHGNQGYNIENIWQSIWGKIKEQMKNKLGRLVGTFGEQNSQTPKIFKLPHPLPQP
jgi:hypothetical protein